MAIGVVQTTDTFQIWFNKTNDLINYVDSNLTSGIHSTTGNVSITGPTTGEVGLYVAKTANIARINVTSSTGLALNVSGNAHFYATVNVRYINASSDIYYNGTSVWSELNTAFRHANSAYAQANVGSDSWARSSANAASSYANSAYLHANASYLKANSANVELNAAYRHANAAYAAANAAAGASISFNSLSDVDTSGALEGNVVYYKASTSSWNVAPFFYFDTATGGILSSNSVTLTGANTNQRFWAEVSNPAQSAKFPGLSTLAYTQGLGGYGSIDFNTARGSKTSPSAINDGDLIGAMVMNGYDSTKFVYGGGVLFSAAANWSTSVNDTKMQFVILKGDGDTPANYITALTLSPKSYGAEIYSYGNSYQEFNGSNGSWIARFKKYGGSNDSGFYLQSDGSMEMGVRNSDGSVLHVIRGSGTSFLALGSADNVSIGNTSTPTHKLHVTGNVKLDWSNSGIIFGDGTTQTTAASASLNAWITSSNATYGQITETVPADDTTPLSSEGRNVVACIVTTTGTTDKVKVEFDSSFLLGTNQNIALSLYRGTTLLKTWSMQTGSGPVAWPATFTHIDSPSTAASHTYSVRIGPDTGTIYMNGSSSARLYGGGLSATIKAKIER